MNGQEISGVDGAMINKFVMRINEIIQPTVQPKTPDQMRVATLKATKDRANTALKNERDRQKRTKAVKALSNLSTLATRKPMGAV